MGRQELKTKFSRKMWALYAYASDGKKITLFIIQEAISKIKTIKNMQDNLTL
jgi:hypothetical protein